MKPKLLLSPFVTNSIYSSTPSNTAGIGDPVPQVVFCCPLLLLMRSLSFTQWPESTLCQWNIKKNKNDIAYSQTVFVKKEIVLTSLKDRNINSVHIILVQLNVVIYLHIRLCQVLKLCLNLTIAKNTTPRHPDGNRTRLWISKKISSHLPEPRSLNERNWGKSQEKLPWRRGRREGAKELVAISSH